jgi:AcrR family transcriptional regulator
MDRRQRKTREAIFRAFTGLLKEESYGKITVQRIIDRADIGRTTFYAHFETKDALLESFCADIFGHVFSEGLGREETHDFSRSRDLRARLTHVLYHLQEHMEYLPGILSGESRDVFMGFFKEHLRELFSGVAAPGAASVPQDYVLNRLVCDFAETVQWWSRNSRYSPEEISGFFFSAVPV